MLHCATDETPLDPVDYARRLTEAVAMPDMVPDDYGRGGVVARLEEKLAAALGKQRAILFPTGTMANLVALRAHARLGARRVILPTESHIVQDCGDGAAELAGLSLRTIPEADFTPAAVGAEIALGQTARVASPIGALVIEAPMRRTLGRFMPLAEQQALCTLARSAGIASHLDGARLYIGAAFSGATVAAVCAPFETVYVSLYKYFRVPFGAVLAGPASLIDDLYHERRRFGGGLHHLWPMAAVAELELPQMAARWQAVADLSRRVTTALTAAGVALHPVPQGTNVLPVVVDDPLAALQRAEAAHVRLPPARGRFIDLRANPDWLKWPEAEVIRRLTAVFAP